MNKNNFIMWKFIISLILLNQMTFAQEPNCVYLVSDVYPGAFGSSPTGLIEFDGALYFASTGNSSGNELWKFEDGVSSMIMDINPGIVGSMPNNFVIFQSDLYFTATTSATGNELFKFDGTSVNLVIDINPGTGSSQISNIKELDGKLYFSANNGSDGFEPFVYDGTVLTQIGDIYSGFLSSNPAEFCLIDDQICFTANNGINGKEFYTWDGLTLTEFDINPGSTGSEPGELLVYQNEVCFHANNGTNGMELFVYDGVTLTMYEINPSGNGNPWDMRVTGGYLYFRAFDLTHGTEIWRFDGSAVEFLGDIRVGPTNSIPHNFTALVDTVYFAANDGVNGNELWKYDGNDVSIALDLYPGGSNSMDAGTPIKFLAHDGFLYMVATNPTSGYEIWRFDGTSPELSRDVMPGAFSSMPNNLIIYNDDLYFTAEDGVHGNELWVWDFDRVLDTSINVVTCGVYTSPAGDDYSTPGTYSFIDTIESVVCIDCDSIISVSLTLTDQPESNLVISECGEYTSPGGQYFDVEGTYSFTDIIPSLSCPGYDSIINIELNLFDDISLATVNFSGVLVVQQPGATYQWLDCDNGFAVIPGANDQDFIVPATGNYACEITLGSCVDTTACLFGEYVDDLDLLNYENTNLIQFYPNPINDVLNLIIDSNDNTSVSITTISGSVVFCTNIQGSGAYEFDLSTLAKGTYFLVTSNSQKVQVYRIMKN